MIRKFTFLFFLLFLMLSSLMTMPARASDRVTLGEVKSYFNAWHNGSIAASINGTGNSGQFQDPLADAAILPFFSAWFTDLHYCVEDYHLYMLAWFGPERESITDFADGLTQTFVVDGQILATERTPIKRRIDSGFGFNEGAILSPDDLDVGAHTMEWYATYPDGSSEYDSFTIHIDALGTGACQ